MDSPSRRRGRSRDYHPRTWLGRLCLRVSFKCFDTTLFLLGPVFVCLVWLLLGFIVWVYLRCYCPALRIYPLGRDGIATTSTGLYLIGNVLFHHISCMLTRPGYVETEPPGGASEPDVEDSHSRTAGKGGEMKYEAGSGNPSGVEDAGARLAAHRSTFCRFCKQPRPPRAHHCHTCKQCVLKMDHHCPWVANCVGLFNYHHFLLLLFHALIGGIFVLSHMISFLKTEGHRKSPSTQSHTGPITLLVVLLVSITGALSFLTSLHLYLLLTNQTSDQPNLPFLDSISHASQPYFDQRLSSGNDVIAPTQKTPTVKISLNLQLVN